jgi:NAD(P)-dependent dehydrogenase (short-subunit alcohol dehydrogenase family)
VDDRIEECIELLERLAEDPARLADFDRDTRQRLRVAAGRLTKLDPVGSKRLRKELRRRGKNAIKAADEECLARTGIRALRQELVYPNALLQAELSLSAEPEAAAAESQQIESNRTESNRTESDRTEFHRTEFDRTEFDRTVHEERRCYVCKGPFHQLHHFYDQLCPPCAELNWAKRQQTADLSGRVALVTGARVKIGYQAALKLLRAGARVIVTTRFPKDASQRYAEEPDFEAWSQRVEIHGLDLRHTPSVEAFARYLCEHEERLDFVLNNACQTVRRPPAFYGHLLESERAELDVLPAPSRGMLERFEERRHSRDALLPQGATFLPDSVELSQLALLPGEDHDDGGLFPVGRLDADLQQVDLRGINSWRLPLADVSTVELLEVHLVNAVAPFVLNARLKSLMAKDPTFDKQIVNVSAMEGQFYRAYKTDKHPHTNMAKAALNMMTRTSAIDYAADGIYMNSVDTGWVTDEDPAEIAARKVEIHRFSPPLDIIDGAARICDPIFHGLQTGEHVWGQFLKDYTSVPW